MSDPDDRLRDRLLKQHIPEPEKLANYRKETQAMLEREEKRLKHVGWFTAAMWIMLVAMGTMYATGHCVSRDLPSAYKWFALALRVDPNNSVVERNLSSVWNQMTPPERQLATKSGQ